MGTVRVWVINNVPVARIRSFGGASMSCPFVDLANLLVDVRRDMRGLAKASRLTNVTENIKRSVVCFTYA